MMNKFTDKPQVILISETHHSNFEDSLNKALSKLWYDGRKIHKINTFCNKDFLFATIIYWT